MTMGNLDDNIKRLLRFGKHSSASLEKDLHELVKGAIESKSSLNRRDAVTKNSGAFQGTDFPI